VIAPWVTTIGIIITIWRVPGGFPYYQEEVFPPRYQCQEGPLSSGGSAYFQLEVIQVVSGDPNVLSDGLDGIVRWASW